jgi:hypothetical protein
MHEGYDQVKAAFDAGKQVANSSTGVLYLLYLKVRHVLQLGTIKPSNFSCHLF